VAPYHEVESKGFRRGVSKGGDSKVGVLIRKDKAIKRSRRGELERVTKRGKRKLTEPQRVAERKRRRREGILSSEPVRLFWK